MENNTGHLHKLKRVLIKNRRTDVFMCTHPTCTFREQAHFLCGKSAACTYCNQEFIIKRMDLHKQGMLHCDACKKRPVAKKADGLQERLEKALYTRTKEEGAA